MALNEIVIALDAMGGDNAPESVLKGAERVIKKDPEVHFLVYGDEAKLSPIVANLKKLKHQSTIRHTTNVIASDERPSVALRKGKGSSMRLAIEAVKSGEANAMISAGNTGALMAMSKLLLRTLPGIDRPAIASIFPTRKGRCVLLDLGANVDCSAENLVQFAIMGDAFAKVLLDLHKPSIGLLNVGSEETKGSDIVKTASEELRDGVHELNYHGYVEGDDITEGVTDVVVTDGFTGNVTLKTAEGTGKICGDYIKEAFRSSPLAMLGGLLARPALKRMFKKMDPRMHNGAMFLGLDGIAVKSHGGTDDIGFANALNVAVDLTRNQINKKINDELSVYTTGTEDMAELEETFEESAELISG